MASFLGEIKRRKVFQVAAAYAVVAWLTIQIVGAISEPLSLPDWLDTVVIVLLAVGFPIAVILAWAFDVTPTGIERTGPVTIAESTPPETIASTTGLALSLSIIGVLALLLVLVGLYLFWHDEPTATFSDADGGRSVAVLPFDNRSAREEDQFFVDGIHDDILTQLARIGSMKVISRTSVMGYRDTDKNLRTIGEELGVATILEGGVQRAGDTIRINVQLIDAATDEHLWAETYDRMLTAENVFAIQSEMSRAIATALEASLSPDDIRRLASVPTQSTRAYDFYLRGNDYFNRPDDQTWMPLAVQMYSQAVAEDSDFAIGWAALSRAHSNMHWYAVDQTPQRLELSLQAAQRALAIDPDLPEAHLALGSYYDHGFRDYAQAQREFGIAERAIPGDPTLIEATAYMLRRMGNSTEALARLERLLDRDPRNVDLIYQTGITSVYLQHYAEADAYWDRALELAPDSANTYGWRAALPMFRDGDVSRIKALAADPPVPIGGRREYYGWLAALYERDYATALDYSDRLEGSVVSGQRLYLPKPLMRGWAHWLAGRDDLAEPEFRAAIAQVEAAIAMRRDDPRLHVALAQAHAGLGEREAAERAGREAMELMPRSRDATQGPDYQLDVITGVFAPLGDVEATVAELDAYLSGRSIFAIEGLLPDPRLDPVRDDPRFQALVEKYRRQ